MLVVADVNTLWRSRPFQALCELQPVLGLQPMDPLISVKKRRLAWGVTRDSQQKMAVLSVVLPFRWATRTAAKALPRLWAAALKECRSIGSEPSALVVTSPHYAPLVEQLSVDIPTYYYCSDDYSNYNGWDANKMREQECLITQQARQSFFVSAALKDRMAQEYRIDDARLSVSMNATDEDFITSIEDSAIEELVRPLPNLKRPIVGVVGGINDRLDFDLIYNVAESAAVGAVLFVGGVAPSSTDRRLQALLGHPKCVFVGNQPHKSLPIWLQALDVALIPFRECAFNSMCSPMRLFDHLAAGRPIVATNACRQVNEFSAYVDVARDAAAFISRVSELCKGPKIINNEAKQLAQRHTWRVRGKALHELLSVSACK